MWKWLTVKCQLQEVSSSDCDSSRHITFNVSGITVINLIIERERKREREGEKEREKGRKREGEKEKEID